MSTKRGGTSKVANFEVGERVLCFNHGMLYEAKILKVKTEGDDLKYHVHYIGWKSTWDEDVAEDNMLKRNEENLKKRNEMFQAQSELKRKMALTEDGGADGPNKKLKGPAGAGVPDNTRKKTIIEIPLPENILVHLVNDWEMVTKDQRLVDVPKKPCVTEILQQFGQTEVFLAHKEEGLHEIIDAVRLYFDVALGKMLLYRFERNQYATLLGERGEKMRASDVYGCEHLLRLLVKLPQLICNNIHMTREAQTTLTAVLTELVQFLSSNLGTLVTEVYDNATSSYISISKSF